MVSRYAVIAVHTSSALSLSGTSPERRARADPALRWARRRLLLIPLPLFLCPRIVFTGRLSFLEIVPVDHDVGLFDILQK
jgi:hypothetical protein